jgi:hypothetical protein
MLFWRCRNRSDLRPYVIAGLLLGVMQYTYIAARFVPLLMLVLAVDWRRTLRGRGVVVALLTAAVVAMPLAIAIYLNPAAGFQRSQQVWLFSRPEPLALFWLQLTAHLKMFGVAGDPIWLHNIPGRPPVAWFVTPFFLAGAIFAVRTPAPRTLLWTVLVMIWPGILAVSGTPLPPNHLRVLVIAPAVFPAGGLWDHAALWRTARRLGAAAGAGACHGGRRAQLSRLRALADGARELRAIRCRHAHRRRRHRRQPGDLLYRAGVVGLAAAQLLVDRLHHRLQHELRRRRTPLCAGRTSWPRRASGWCAGWRGCTPTPTRSAVSMHSFVSPVTCRTAWKTATPTRSSITRPPPRSRTVSN